jgi:hypothetical protein
MSIRIGDASRRRRTADPVRQAFYAWHRARRFARHFLGEPSVELPRLNSFPVSSREKQLPDVK